MADEVGGARQAVGLADEGAPVGTAGRAVVAAAPHVAAAVGVVELEDGGLRKGVRRALADRVLGVALHLGRTPLVALHEQRMADGAHRHRRREKGRHAGDHLLRLARVREDGLGGAAATGEAGHRGTGAHHLEERTARGLGVAAGRLG